MFVHFQKYHLKGYFNFVEKQKLIITKKRGAQRPQGQILIAVLVIVAISIAIALTVSTRTVTEQRIATVVDESAKALSLAEAGVEEAYREIMGGNPDLNTSKSVNLDTGGFRSDEKANYIIQSFGGDTKAFVSPNLVPQGEAFQVLLAPIIAAGLTIDCNSGSRYLSTGLLKLYFGSAPANTSDDRTPALAVSVYYRNAAGNFANQRLVIEPYSSVSPRFTPPAPQTPLVWDISAVDQTIPAANNNLNQALTFAYRYDLNLAAPVAAGGMGLTAADKLCLIRVRPLFNSDASHRVAIAPVGSNSLPLQGFRINSTGINENTDTSRKLQVNLSYPAFPGIGDFVLFNGSDTAIRR